MSPILAATALLVLGGVAGMGWMLWPSLRPEPPAATDEEAQSSDSRARLDVLLEAGCEPDDSEVCWDQTQPMLPDEPRRIPWDFAVAEVLPVIHDGDRHYLVPLSSALIQLDDPDAPDIFCGRRQGRVFHGVRLEAGLYLDLIEALRLLPIIAVELDARGIQSREIELHGGMDEVGAPEEGLATVASWLAGMPGPRVLPEGDGSRPWRFVVGGHTVELLADLPALAQGIRSDELGWAGVLWMGALSESGATPLELLEGLVDDAPALHRASLERWRWSRPELTELSSLGHYLEQQQIGILALVRDAFADHTVPMPDLHDELQSLVAAAVLNWVAVVHRRAGYPRRAVGLLDAALRATAPTDDDTRADIHHNRGTCRFQIALDGDSGPEDLQPVLQDFELAARLNPGDPHCWVQIALVHELLDQPKKAEDAWLQAATRTREPDAQMQLVANAQAMKSSAVPDVS